jgi:hypothetical protein
LLSAVNENLTQIDLFHFQVNQRLPSNASSLSWANSTSSENHPSTIKEEKIQESKFPSYDKASTASNEQQSENSSLSSVEIENPIEADSQLFEIDLGFGSMSLSEQSKIISDEDQHQTSVDELEKEIKSLKEEKLDLLRQNVVSLREIFEQIQ